MLLVQRPYFEPGMKKINSESQVISLLEDARDSLVQLGCDLEDVALKDILRVVEEGHCSERGTEKIDLTSTRELINQYRKETELGCPSCKNYKEQSRDIGGMVSVTTSGKSDWGSLMYCELQRTSDGSEDLKTEVYCSYFKLTLEADHKTKKVEEHWEKGCDERVPVLECRPLEKIL